MADSPIVFPDFIRLPTELDTTQSAYKDWLHLNVIDSAEGWIGIFNASLHGSPRDRRSLALGTALVHHPKRGWFGNVEVMEQSLANIQPGFIGLEHIGISTVVAPAGVRLNVDRMGERSPMEPGVSADITGTALEAPMLIELPLPFGNGWISWAIAPRLRPSGSFAVKGNADDRSPTAIEIRAGTQVYHDHNWGRWYWGDDIGWEWGYFQARTIAIVFARTTNRSHTLLGPAWFSVHSKDSSRRFASPSVSSEFSGHWNGRLRRLPGAMAALHQDRAQPWLPQCITVRGVEGKDDLSLTFTTYAAAQLIAADPLNDRSSTRNGFSFVHEMPGEFVVEGMLNGKEIREKGHAIFEYVD